MYEIDSREVILTQAQWELDNFCSNLKIKYALTYAQQSYILSERLKVLSQCAMDTERNCNK